MRNHFDRIYSIEYVSTLAERAARIIWTTTRTLHFLRDIRMVMPEILRC